MTRIDNVVAVSNLRICTWVQKSGAKVESSRMPKGPEGQQRPADVIGNAILVARIATGEVEELKSVRSGRTRSGIAGARARNENTTQEYRTAIAKKAAAERWG